jgi:proliferating cell nuclear antigen
MTFKATLIGPGILIDSLSSIAELIDEGIFKITQNGITLVAADRAMVAVADFHLSKAAFQEYEVDTDQSMGLNILNLLSVLKRSSGKDTLKFNLMGNRLHIEMVGDGRRKFVVPLVDLTQDEIPQIEQLEFAAKVELRPDILQSGIEDAEIVSDSVLFVTSPEKFIMRSEGDSSSAELEMEKGNPKMMALEAVSETKSRYPLDYLKKMFKAAKIADSVMLQFGQDYPMKISFKAGDRASLKFVLAPRVSDAE